ncbi:MAG TPA: SRPBCC family protein [Candidatus Polarisedimenticolia bacterium]|nr:SRPBCC family protein [Candidatus Polarisedimenticolia bacterium]
MLVLVTALVILLFFAVGMARLVACREIDTRRTVMLHLPPERVWQLAADIPAFLAAHARGRPILEITGWRIVHGDGQSPGTIWRSEGTWERRPYWSEIELLAIRPPYGLAVRLVRDALGTQHALLRHRVEMHLIEVRKGRTKLTWRLSARIHRVRMLFGRYFASERIEARLLDIRLRSVKVALELDSRAQDRLAARAGVRRDDPLPAPAALGSPVLSAASRPFAHDRA